MKTLIYLLLVSSITMAYNTYNYIQSHSNQNYTVQTVNSCVNIDSKKADVKLVTVQSKVSASDTHVHTNEISICSSTHQCSNINGTILSNNNFKALSKRVQGLYNSIPNIGMDSNYKIIEIRVSKDSGFFHTIKEAVNSISQLQYEVKYNIIVDKGIYIEETIDLTGRPHVNIIGDEAHKTIIKASNSAQSIFLLGAFNEVSFLRLTETNENTPAIVCLNSGDFSIGRDLIIDHCGYGIIVKSNLDNLPTGFFGDRIEMVNMIHNPIVIESSLTGNVLAQLQNLVVITTSGHSAGILVSGKNASANIISSCFHKSEKVSGIAIYSLNGAKLNNSEIHLLGWENENLMASK